MKSLKTKGSHPHFLCRTVNSLKLYKPRASLEIPRAGMRKLLLRILWVRGLILTLVSLMVWKRNVSNCLWW
jgi:hypothetical protein